MPNSLLPITDYASLAAAIPVMAERSDAEYLSSIPVFIQRAEDRLFRNLRCPGNEKEGMWAASAGDNTRAVAIPDDYLEVKLLFYGQNLLERVTDQRMAILLAQNPTPGTPRYFARITGKLVFFPTAAVNDDVWAVYYSFQGPISADGLTWTKMLRIAPFAYLYGALAEGARFIRDAQETALWDARFEAEFGAIMGQAMDNEVAGSTVVVNNLADGGERGW